jgi:type II secretory pathway component GspD/PulD (secretin)
MKSLILFLSGAAVALICVWLASSGPDRKAGPTKNTFSSFDPPRGSAAAVQFDTGALKLADADLEQVLNLYQEVSARTVLRATNLPQVKISLRNQTPLTRVETLQLLDTALEQNGVTMVLVGDASVKAVPNRNARSETPPVIDPKAGELPDSSSYMTCTIRLNKANPDQVVGMLGTVSRMGNSVVYVPTGKVLILRDYSSSIRQMLPLIQKAENQLLPWGDSLIPATNRQARPTPHQLNLAPPLLIPATNPPARRQ